MPDAVMELPSDPVRFVEAQMKRAFDFLAAESAQEPPGLLHHYTSGQGLLGILSSGEIHCTNILYMNDASEMDYGRALTIRLLEEERSSIPDILHLHLDKIKRMLEQPDFQYFVSCFCEKPDLLSQWRAYGAQAAGYSIGFSTDDLLNVLPEYSELIPVTYNSERQSEMIRAALRNCLSIAGRCCVSYRGHERFEDALLRWDGAVSEGLGRLIVRMKSEAFAEEHEWRAVIARFTFDTSKVNFRLAANGIVIPYLPWRFKREGIKAIRQIRHGPTVNPLLAGRSVGVLLYNLGYRDVSVSGSAIPLRA